MSVVSIGGVGGVVVWPVLTVPGVCHSLYTAASPGRRPCLGGACRAVPGPVGAAAWEQSGEREGERDDYDAHLWLIRQAHYSGHCWAEGGGRSGLGSHKQNQSKSVLTDQPRQQQQSDEQH